MPRTYIVSVEGITVTTVRDLLQIKGAAGKLLRIVRWKWVSFDPTLNTAQMIPTRCRFLPATVTDGSAGSTATPRPVDPGDAAASFTCLTNNTTQASSSGTATIVDEDSRHLYNGYEQQGTAVPLIGPGQSFTFETLQATTGSPKLSWLAEVEESGGG